MYQALYRKWRPQNFNDVVGQQNITVTLAKEVENGNISHAYLFTGSRGTGKTTCAKILAKAVNCLDPQSGNPCNVCAICTGIDSGSIMDVVELDAASNNGVDYIRDMIDETNFTPVQAKKRVYIIDEVHMLSQQACNAFLKTLEEPREHVIFILATTDPQKLLPTVRSRCQRFDFRRITPEDIAGRLAYIAGQEGFSLDGDAAALIARIADGGLRDAISLLDLCATTDKNVTVKTVSAVAGIADKEFLFVLTNCIKSGDTGKALELVNELHNSFSDMAILCSEFINHLRSLMLIKTVKTADTLIACTKEDYERLVKQAGQFMLEEILDAMFLLEETAFNLSKGYNKRTELELAVIRLCAPLQKNGSEALLTRLAALEKAVYEGIAMKPAAVVTPPVPTLPATDTPTIKVPAAPIAAPVIAPVIEPAVVENPEETEELIQEPLPETAASALEPDPAGDEPKLEAQAVEEEPVVPEPSQSVCLPVPPEPKKDFWQDVLKMLYGKNPVLWSYLRPATVYVEGDTLFVCLANAEAVDKLINKEANISMMKLCLANSCGADYKIIFKKEQPSAAGSDSKVKEDLLETINNIKNNL
jgi:DNA polymerase III subunit gamma/tau